MRITNLVFLSFLLLFSCKKDNEVTLYGNDECLPENVSFSGYIMPLINNSCATTACHVQGGSGNGLLENYAQVKVMIDNGSFEQRVVVEQNMPSSENLSSCQIETIRQWIEEGALNN